MLVAGDLTKKKATEYGTLVNRFSSRRVSFHSGLYVYRWELISNKSYWILNVTKATGCLNVTKTTGCWT